MKFKICTHLGSLGTFNERYVPEGYHPPMGFEESIEAISKITDIKGVIVWYPGHPMIENPDKLLKMLNNYGLEIAGIAPEVWTSGKWKNGALTDPDKKIRKEAIKIVKTTMDLALEMKAHSVLLWPAHDGYDYCFQGHFEKTWDILIETLNEIGSHNSNVKVSIEYKQRDPRAKSLIEDVGKLLFLIQVLDVDNIGGAMDLGHALLAQERPAESLALLKKYNKLYEVHLNDNYRDADPDLLFGTINFWDTLELFYWLQKIEYNDWLNLDIITPRDDRVKMLKLAADFVRDFESLSSKLMQHEDIIDKNLTNHNFVDNMDLIRKLVF